VAEYLVLVCKLLNPHANTRISVAAPHLPVSLSIHTLIFELILAYVTPLLTPLLLCCPRSIAEVYVQLGIFRDDRTMFDRGLKLWKHTHDKYLRFGTGKDTVTWLPKPDVKLLKSAYNSDKPVTMPEEAKQGGSVAAPPDIGGPVGQVAKAALLALQKDAASVSVRGSRVVAGGNVTEEIFNPRRYLAAQGEILRVGKGHVKLPRLRGECTETLRDLPHAQFGLGGLLQVAELAWQQVGGRRGVEGRPYALRNCVDYCSVLRW
jgi:hypothetical protein